MSHDFAGHAIDLFSMGMLLTAIGVVWIRSLRQALVLFAAQSLMLAAAAGCVGLALGASHILAGAALTLLTKAFLVPCLLWLILLRLPDAGDVQASISRRLSVVLAVALALLLARSLDAQPFHSVIGAGRILPTAVTVMMVGMLLMITERHVLSQILGFLVLENGMALAALTATFGMPLVVELGIALDLLLVMFVALAYAGRIHAIFGSLDTRHLRSLRG